jgi:hypothetical protein
VKVTIDALRCNRLAREPEAPGTFFVSSRASSMIAGGGVSVVILERLLACSMAGH